MSDSKPHGLSTSTNSTISHLPSANSEAMATAAYATKFGVLLQGYEAPLNNIENGIAHSTEAAIDLEDSNVLLEQSQQGRASSSSQDEQIIRLDDSVKAYIDMVYELQTQKRILEDMRMQLTSGQQLGDGMLVEWFEQKYTEAQREWSEKSEEQRYHNNEEYVEFRRKLWEKRHPNQPFTMTPGEVQDADDELAIVSQNESLICPLTQSILDDPVTSQVCRHSYSAKSIADHIKISERTNHSGRAECPVAGCLKYVKLSDLKANKSLARLAARKRAQAGDTDEDSDEYTMME